MSQFTISILTLRISRLRLQRVNNVFSLCTFHAGRHRHPERAAVAVRVLSSETGLQKGIKAGNQTGASQLFSSASCKQVFRSSQFCRIYFYLLTPVDA